MTTQFTIRKATRTKSRRLPFLPRFGLMVDIAGKEIVWKQASILETLLAAKSQGFSIGSLTKIAREQLSELNIQAARAFKPKVIRKQPLRAAAIRRKAGRHESDT